MNDTPGSILAIDYGRVRMGLALSLDPGGAPIPLPPLRRGQGREATLLALEEMKAQYRIRMVVLGLPLHADRSESPICREVRNWGKRIHRRLGIPVTYEDEHLSSHEAESRLEALGLSSRQRADANDSTAAQIILESYLEHHP